MLDYEPIDISQWCNKNINVLDIENGPTNSRWSPIVGATRGTPLEQSADRPPIGNVSFRGLPFLIGNPDPGIGNNHLVVLGGETGEISIPIGQPATYIIIAHRLIKSEVPTGGRLGIEVADYVLKHSDGRKTEATIRERFEIVALPGPKDIPGVPGSPYLAFTDENAKLAPRYEGDWDSAGRRLTEAEGAKAHWFYLWAFKNPVPELSIESFEIIPKGPNFAIGGLTLSHVKEFPFAREGRRPVRITLTNETDAEKPFDLDVSVDRGDTTYVHPLPGADKEAFLSDNYKGYGEKQNDQSSPAYAEISAIPSATVTVKHGDEEVGSVKWDDVTKGAASTPRMKIEMIDPGKNWVRVKVVDDETGQPVPCRVHFRSPEGVPYQPHGHHNQVNSNLGTWHVDVGGDTRLGQITYAYIDGKCEGWLPRGEVIVDVARGFEYEPLRENMTIRPGQQELNLRLKRWTNMNKLGWFSGDSHVHFLGTQGAHSEALGEDLNVVNLLQSQWGSLFTNTEDFTGEPSISQTGNSIVYTSQENRQHFMGHMILWGLKEPVMPWCSDGLGEGEIGGTMETTLADWADKTHAQGGYVINPHFPNPNGEPAALVATGRLDGIEMIRKNPFNHSEYYRYLNCGYRLPLVGGTDKMSSDVPVGLYRTYARIGENEFTYDNWCKAVAAGRTILSGGPIMHLSVDGHDIGDTLKLSGAGTVELEAWTESILPINTLQIIQEGKVIASVESKEGTRRLEIKEKVRIDSNTWIGARCGGPEYDGLVHYDSWERGVFAHTSPIYISVGGEWEMYNEDTFQYMLTMIEGDLAYIRESSGQHTHGMVTHHHGEDDHIAYLERPFIEARDAINTRMARLGLV